MTTTYASKPENPMPSATQACPLEAALLKPAASKLLQQIGNAPMQRQLTQAYQTIGFPSQKQEAYKYLPTAALGRLNVVNAPTLDVVNMPMSWQLSANPAEARTLVFINGVVSAVESTLISQPLDGVTLTPWHNTLPEDTVLKDANTSPDHMERLSLATLNDGMTIHIAANTTVQPALHILFVESAADTACQTDTETEPPVSYSAGRLHIEAAENSHANIMVHTLAVTPSPTLANHALRAVVKKNAQLNLTLSQHTVENHWQFMATRFMVAANANASLTTLGTGQGRARLHVEAHIDGSAAHFEHNGSTVIAQQGRQWIHSEIHHHAPEATSHQHVKALLNNDSQHDFDAVIVVDQPAQLTDAKQLNNNMLLSENARAYARPQLRINADDVKCAHGATVGQLDEDALFYLQSRGLNTELAQCLLTYGFASEPLDNIASPIIKNWTNQHLLVALGQQESPLGGCMMDCTTCHGHSTI